MPEEPRSNGPNRGAGWGGAARDEAAASDLAVDETFGFEQFVGGGNGGPVQSKCTSQFASGWQPLAFR